jgi:hypothetical protein
MLEFFGKLVSCGLLLLVLACAALVEQRRVIAGGRGAAWQLSAPRML